ncbi:MAG TPA: ASCH domain-containing protein [Gemmataceae bacterium]|jgi:hypothetical protein|nr:ASCH domain-containing protein [Gemmataceae bacterium]
MTQTIYALSLKQPWATLLVHGLKQVEVRRWATSRRGRVLIHAARVSDPRAEAWAKVPKELQEQAKMVGGIIGQAELTGCKIYRTMEAFAAEQALHLNDPAWFEPPLLYGFTFARAVQLPFQRYAGWFRFFPVKWQDG